MKKHGTVIALVLIIGYSSYVTAVQRRPKTAKKPPAADVIPQSLLQESKRMAEEAAAQRRKLEEEERRRAVAAVEQAIRADQEAQRRKLEEEERKRVEQEKKRREEQARLAALQAKGTETTGKSTVTAAGVMLKKLEKHRYHNPAGITVGPDSNLDYLRKCSVGHPANVVAQGKHIEIAKSSYVVQLATADQHTECKECGGNIGGGNESCGYHAVKNSILTALALLKPDYINPYMTANAQYLGQNLTDFRFIALKFYKEPIGCKGGEWRDYLCKNFSDDKALQKNQGEWLTSKHIERLLNKDFEAGMLSQIKEKVSIIVLDSIEMLPLFYGENFKKAWGSGQDVLYVFIINAIIPPATMGHWFAIAAYKNKGTKYFIILDSKNIVRFADPNLITLITYAENERFDPKKVPEIAEEIIKVKADLDKRMKNLKTLSDIENTLRVAKLYKQLGGSERYLGRDYETAINFAAVTLSQKLPTKSTASKVTPVAKKTPSVPRAKPPLKRR